MKVQVTAATVGAAVVATVLGVQYVRALAPAAASDRFAACTALKPQTNTTLGPLPVPAPDFSAVDYTGAPTTLAAYRGKVVFVNFWQTACPPCREEAPDLEAMVKKVGSNDFAVLAMASETSFAPVRQFFPAGSGMTVLLDPPSDDTSAVGGISREYGTTKWPESYLIDRDGRVRYYFISTRKWGSDNSVDCIKALLAE